MSLQSQIDRFIDACKTGDISCVQEILNAAADLDASRSTSQIIHAQDDYALRWAARKGHEAVCRLLIEHGANIHAQDDYALRRAAENGHEAVCWLLIKHGANIRAGDDYALRWAATNGHEAVCQLLIEGRDPFTNGSDVFTPGADIHAENDCALRWATRNGHEAVCRLLIEHGANIHAIGDYALRCAAVKGHEAVCRLLIEHGADIHADNDEALRWAAKKGHEAVCQLLLELDPLMARCIKPKYSKGVLRVFQAYGDHNAITEALMGSSRRSPFTDGELAYIASCFISRKSAFQFD